MNFGIKLNIEGGHLVVTLVGIEGTGECIIGSDRISMHDLDKAIFDSRCSPQPIAEPATTEKNPARSRKSTTKRKQ